VTRHAQRTITTLAGILVSLLLTIAGSAVLLWGTSLPQEQEFVRELLKAFGSIVVGVGILAFMWELFTKRSFLEETLALANMAVELKNAGIEQVTNDYLSNVQWAEMLKAPQTLELFFAYARTWCNVNTVCLGEIVRMKNRTLRILLPDPRDPQVVNELARRFSSTPQKVEASIEETRAFFEKLGSRTGQGTAVKIRYAPAAPLFSMYLLGERAVFSLYAHDRGKGHVPTCVVKRDGLMYRYLEEEFSFLWNSATAVSTNGVPNPETENR
jgi:hypothetical protein